MFLGDALLSKCPDQKKLGNGCQFLHRHLVRVFRLGPQISHKLSLKSIVPVCSCLICLVARGFDENGENGFVPKAGHEKSSYLMVLL
jgi:hypothetical protein